MLWNEIRNIPSDKKTLKNFGITLGVFFGLAGAFFLWRGRNAYTALFALGAFFLLFGVAAPEVLKPIQKGWMTAALMMGWVMTRALLCALYYLVVTPIGWVARISGKKFLDIEFSPTKASYWVVREKKQEGKKGYENQF